MGVVTLGSCTSEGMASSGLEVGSELGFEAVGYLVGLYNVVGISVGT